MSTPEFIDPDGVVGRCELQDCFSPAATTVSYPHPRTENKRLCERHAERAVEEADAARVDHGAESTESGSQPTEQIQES